jgi:hypothetical protein
MSSSATEIFKYFASTPADRVEASPPADMAALGRFRVLPRSSFEAGETPEVPDMAPPLANAPPS